ANRRGGMSQHPWFPRAGEPREEGGGACPRCQGRDFRNHRRRSAGPCVSARDRSPQRNPLHKSFECAEARPYQAPHQEAAKGRRMGVMRIIFLGTPEFAVSTLDAIISAGHNVPLVVT